MIKISPSILSADFANLGAAVKDLEQAGADYIHVDVMDGSFVPQITFGAKMVASLKGCTALPLDVHLMIQNPHKHINDFAKAGADIITFHGEASEDIVAVIGMIKAHGKKVGISIKPATPISFIEKYLDMLDMVLVMTVEPGYGGQKMMEATLDKVSQLRAMRPELDIEVDGGINGDTIHKALEAGANVIVAGSYVFGGDIGERIESLRG
jgi:ribulose-phosphate 3-epimerase